MIAPALQRRVDDQVAFRRRQIRGIRDFFRSFFSKGRYEEMESEVSRLYGNGDLTWDESDKLLRQLQNVPWQNRTVDIFFD